MPLAACLLLVLGAALAYQQLRDPDIIGPPTTTAAPIQNGGDLTGLPIGQQRKDTPCENAVQADRQPFYALEDFFRYGDMKTFVLAQVTDIQMLPPEYNYQSGRQQSTLEIIDWAYNQPAGAREPVVLTLTQSLYHDNAHSCIGEPILLRKGGVYLLPLGCFDWEGEDYWHVMGEEDVLFEVDERGMVFSHSDFPAFAAYDGKPYAALLEDIRAVVRDNPLLARYARFARALQDEVPLAVITILDGGTKGSSHLTQRAGAEQILVQGTGRSWQVQLSEGEFELNTYGHEAQALPGERYLVFIYGNEIEYSFEANRAARINADGTITPLTEDWNVFSELAGMTVEQVQALAEQTEPTGQAGSR